MHRVEPEIHVVAETVVNREGLASYLESIGAVGWESDAVSEIEEIVEVMGRSCYKSFGVGLNPNVTRTRKENGAHLANLLAQGHDSVLEHGWVSFMFTNVSRVFTHELVRHRVGVAISQESLRYVRLTDLGLWLPSCFWDNSKAVAIFERAWQQAEANYAEVLSEEVLGFNLDEAGFEAKKEFTSAARRLAPIGLSTNIGWSCNVRTLRHCLEMRTGPGAEEEMRLVFGKVGRFLQAHWPHLLGDYEVISLNGLPYFATEHRKV